ncbi:MAG: phosphoribosylglycinamide formyltransferase [Lachnospiraceae bacterium]|jgi:phosphoribosylglycinamide formyltransferase-1|nr:phosphoribosylglycinamide formyltransferase [Lachnospiraceae bacterium]
MPVRFCVLVSGGGTNLQAILDALDAGVIKSAQIAAVVSNNPGAYALTRARNHGVETAVISPKSYETRDDFHDALLEKLVSLDVRLVVLAGFMVTLPPQVIRAFPGRILNVHPSLIPSFCGVGCYGLRVHEMALARGVKVTGATVHVVDEGVDSGPILLQKAVEVHGGDTPETLQRRVMEEAEWVLLPRAIEMVAAGMQP